MIYFIITIVTFIIAQFLIPDFQDKFLVPFQGDNQTGTAETADKDSVIQHIKAAETAAAAEANDTQTGTAEIDAAPKALSRHEDGGGQVARILIFVFSYIALWAVLYMLYKRSRHLRTYTLLVFKYLVVREAYNTARRTVKIEDETFGKSLLAAEQYLTDSDWTLARFSVDQIIFDYHNLYSEKFKLKKDGERGE